MLVYSMELWAEKCGDKSRVSICEQNAPYISFVYGTYVRWVHEVVLVLLWHVLSGVW